MTISSHNPSPADDRRALNRRQLLKTTTAAAVVSIAGFPPATSSAADDTDAPNDSSSAIAVENRQPGTTDWQLTRVRINEGSYRTSLIEGYCSHQSIAAGDVLRVYVSTRPARKFTLDIYRTGFLRRHGRMP